MEVTAKLEGNFKEVTDAAGENWQIPLCGQVSALRSHWEARSVTTSGEETHSSGSSRASPTLEELRKRLDRNGYVQEIIHKKESSN